MRNRILAISIAALAGAAVSGCVTSAGAPAQPASVTRADPAQERVIAEQQTRIKTLERELEEQERTAAIKAEAATTASVAGDLFPPDAEAGRCYARVLVPAQYREDQETVLLREASERVEIIPAQYEQVEETVLVREASSRLEIIPARYETRTETVLVQPETTSIEEIPATYKTVTEEVLVAPARTEWKRGPAASFAATGSVLESRTSDTGEVICLVEVPAQYKTVTTTVVDQPARTREIVMPAEYKTIEQQVLVEPATTREISIPAEYGTVTVTKVVQPAAERRVEIPAEYDTVTKRITVGEERVEWRRVVCDVNLTPSNIRTLQTALRDGGHYSGPIDGILGRQTLAGANAYAISEGLPTGSNYIAIQVAEQLGLSY